MVRVPESDKPKPQVFAEAAGFVENVLGVQLQKHQECFQSKTADMEQWSQLKRMLTQVKALNMSTMKGRYNLGSNIYVPVVIPDTSKITIHLGSGVFVEMSLEDAIVHADSQVRQIERQLAFLNDSMAKSTAEIRFMECAMSELDNLR